MTFLAASAAPTPLYATYQRQILALGVFLEAHGVVALFAARIVQGLAAGTGIGAIGAGMLDIDEVRGAVANATAPGLGTSSGALMAAFAVQWPPAPTRLVYVAWADCSSCRPSAWSSCRRPAHRLPVRSDPSSPDWPYPSRPGGPMLAAAPVLFAVWALAGFYRFARPQSH